MAVSTTVLTAMIKTIRAYCAIYVVCALRGGIGGFWYFTPYEVISSLSGGCVRCCVGLPV
jgi:membrane associated rhomboid family serine protease